MLAASSILRQASGYSHTLECVVDFYQNGVLAWESAPVVGGTLTADRGATVRLNCDLTVAIEEWAELPVDNRGGRFKVRRGLGTLGFRESLQLGEFRIDDIKRPSTGVVSITGSGLESYIVDARFLTPRTPAYGASTIDQIRTLVTEVLPDAQFELRNTRDKRVTATATWDRDRADAIEALANSIGAEVWVNSAGHWVISDRPNPLIGSPVYLADEGVGGVLIGRTETDTRDRVYNAASVSGQSSDQNVPPVWAWAADLNTASPTYFYGPFGQKPIFYSSQFFTATAQCQAYADALLAESLAANVKLDFSVIPVDFLEVGDLIGVRDRRGRMQALLLQSFRAGLGVDGGMSCETLSSKTLIADGV
jgi:Domain of unknown function (DUF5047)